MNFGRRGNATCIRHKLTDSFDINRVLSRQQMSQRIGDRILSFASRKLQNLHVYFVRDFFGMSGS